MTFQIHNITEENKQEVQEYFRENFLEMKDKSLVARLYVAKIIEQEIGRKLEESEKKLLETYKLWNEGITIQDAMFYFGISHKDEIVCIWVDTKKISVDVEILKIRFQSVLDTFSEAEYAIFGERRWVEFYIMWTAKEALIKYLGLNLDTMWDIQILKAQEENVRIWTQIFDLKLELYYDWKSYTVSSWRDWNTMYALIS